MGSDPLTTWTNPHYGTSTVKGFQEAISEYEIYSVFNWDNVLNYR